MNHQTTDHQPKRRSSHGAGWLKKLLTLGLGAAIVLTVMLAFWLIVTLPVMYPGAPRIPIPLAVTVAPNADLISPELAGSGLRSLEVGEVLGELKVTFESAWKQWLYTFFLLLELVLIVLILGLLRRIVGSIAEGEAFSTVNAGRLRWVALLFIVEAIYGPGISKAMTAFILNDVHVTGGDLMVYWGSEMGRDGFITGWVLLILSEVFRQGADLRAEHELTI